MPACTRMCRMKVAFLSKSLAAGSRHKEFCAFLNGWRSSPGDEHSWYTLALVMPLQAFVYTSNIRPKDIFRRPWWCYHCLCKRGHNCGDGFALFHLLCFTVEFIRECWGSDECKAVGSEEINWFWSFLLLTSDTSLTDSTLTIWISLSSISILSSDGWIQGESCFGEPLASPWCSFDWGEALCGSHPSLLSIGCFGFINFHKALCAPPLQCDSSEEKLAWSQVIDQFHLREFQHTTITRQEQLSPHFGTLQYGDFLPLSNRSVKTGSP